MNPDHIPMIALVGVVAVILVTFAVRRAWGKPPPSEGEELPRAPTVDICECCTDRPATHVRPRTTYRARDYALDPHASRAYGLAPRPMVSVDPQEGDEPAVCLPCQRLYVRSLEQFQAGQYEELSRLISSQASAAMAFEARGLRESARKALRGDSEP